MNDMPETLQHIYLGSEVVSKKTGFPGVGRVIGIYLAGGYKFISERAIGPHEFTRWDTLYPNWISGLVFIVYYEKARKTLTWDEWQTGYDALPEERKILSKYQLKEEYDKLPMMQVVAYPHEDLELFE